MGQRLVIDFTRDCERIASIYYHWSGYTKESIYRIKEISNDIDFELDFTTEEIQRELIEFVGRNGGGAVSNEGLSEHEYIRNKFPGIMIDDDGYNRNNGLVAISEEGMDALHSWVESSMEIDVDTCLVYNDCFWDYGNYENYVIGETMNEIDPAPLENIPELEFYLGEFSLNDAGWMYDALDDIDGFLFRDGEQIFGLID